MTDAGRSKSRDKIAVHRVFVDVDFDLAHRRRSAPVLFFEGRCLPLLRFQVRVDLRLVGVAVSKSRMNLRERNMPDLPGNFLGNQAHVVPLGDPTN